MHPWLVNRERVRQLASVMTREGEITHFPSTAANENHYEKPGPICPLIFTLNGTRYWARVTSAQYEDKEGDLHTSKEIEGQFCILISDTKAQLLSWNTIEQNDEVIHEWQL